MGSIFQKPPNNYQYYVGQSNLVNYRFDSITQTAPITNQPLHTNIIVPARTIVQNGQRLRLSFLGLLGANGAGTTTFFVQLNAVALFTAVLPLSALTRGWEIYIDIFCQDFVTNLATMWAVLFGNYTTGVTGGTPTLISARNQVVGFGNGFNADNTFQVLVTDTTGTEQIIQEISYVEIQ